MRRTRNGCWLALGFILAVSGLALFVASISGPVVGASAAPPPKMTVPPPIGGERDPAGLSGVVVHVDMVDLRFSPADIVIAPGTTVIWTNRDQTAHTSTSKNFDMSLAANQQPLGAWNSFPLNPGQSFARTFDDVGTSQYFCMVHPFMTGSVEVRANAPAGAYATGAHPGLGAWWAAIGIGIALIVGFFSWLIVREVRRVNPT